MFARVFIIMQKEERVHAKNERILSEMFCLQIGHFSN